MAKITTEDCKNFIIKEFKLDNDVKIKRLRKYKNENGLNVRDFEINNGISCSILENNDGSLHLLNIKKEKVKFNDSELTEANNFLKKLVKKLKDVDSDDAEDEFEELIDNYKKKRILPSQFYFNFPKNAYGNLEKNIKFGLDSSFKFKKDFPERADDHFASSFCFKIIIKDKEIDEYYQLLFPINTLIKENFIPMDEEHYDLSHNAKNTDMKIKDVIEYLENLGFEYKKDPDNSEHCLFSEYKIETPKEDINENKGLDVKKLLKSYIKDLEKGEYDIIEDAINKIKKMSNDDKYKIANEFNFFFPNDTYNNDIKTIDNGLNTLMIRKGKYEKECYCIYFYDNLNSDPDLYLSDILTAILPEYIDKLDEYNFGLELYKKDLENTTINDIIELLENLGFKYKDNPEFGDESCMLRKLGLK